MSIESKRNNLLNGIHNFPKSIFKQLGTLTQEEELGINTIWNIIWSNFLNEKKIDTVYLYEYLNNEYLFNKLLYYLSNTGYITSTMDNNYCSIEFNKDKLLKWLSNEEILEIKRKYRLNHYKLYYNTTQYNDLVKTTKGIVKTGLIRNGFKKAGNHQFKYDIYYIDKYHKEIAQNILKGIKSSTKDITYQEINELLLIHYSNFDNVYSLNDNISDSRGRSIFKCTSKIFNPISHKVARCLIRCQPRKLTNEGLNNVFAFISELLGYRGKNIQDKINYGINSYSNTKNYSIEEMNDTHNYDKLHEALWLERIYKALDSKYYRNEWDIPIEIDALASAVQFIGLILGDRNYLDGTNIINGDNFKDIWVIDGLSREHVKRAITPILYGSSADPISLWINHQLEYNGDMKNIITKELDRGIFRNARLFKDFIIENVKPKEEMLVNIWNDTFKIFCNKFRWDVSNHKEYHFLISNGNIIRTITRDTALTPDLEQFKRYFVTLLIHNLDSQVANMIAYSMDWVLPNHDAFVLHPNDAIQCRELYLTGIKDIYVNRKYILHNYLQNIGINKDYEGQNLENIPLEEFSPYCLK